MPDSKTNKIDTALKKTLGTNGAFVNLLSCALIMI